MAKAATPVFSPAEMLVIKPAIRKVWNYIGMDVEDACGNNNEGAIEVCIDADRLVSCGHSPEADKIVTDVLKTTDYSTVLKFLSMAIPLV